jgi:hypothetical protein
MKQLNTMRNLLTGVLAMVFVLGCAGIANAQTYTYDFGTSTGSHTSGASTSFFSDTPTNGGTYRVRVGTAGGGFELVNPGTSLGSGTELQVTAATSTATNKFGIHDWSSASETLHLSFKLRTTSSTNGNLAVVFGNSTIATDNNGYTGQYNNSLGVFSISYNSGNLSAVNRRIPGSNSSISGSGFAKDTDHEVQVFANNSAVVQNYTKGEENYTLAAQSWDLWVDGVKVSPANGWPKANNPGLSVGNISGIGFFAESSTSNGAMMILDDIEYSPVLPFTPPSGPSISTSVISLTNFFYTVNDGPSSAQSFEVSGENLTDNISVTGTTNFEISLSNDPFNSESPITLTQTGGIVTTTDIFVRLKSGLGVGAIAAESIEVSSTDAEGIDVQASGEVFNSFEIPFFNGLRTLEDYNEAVAQEFNFNDAVLTTAAGGRIDISPNGYLESPTIDLGNYNGIRVTFDLQNLGTGSDRELTVQLSTNNGDIYTGIETHPINATSAVTFSTDIDLSAITESTNGKIRFQMTNGTGGIRFRDLYINELTSATASLTTSEGYRLLSSPVATTLQSLLKDNNIFTQCFTGATYNDTACEATNVGPNVFFFNATSGEYEAATNITNAVPAGTGVLVYVYGKNNIADESPTWPKTVSISGVAHTLPVSPSLNATQNGFTLLGNPSPSTINFNNFAKVNVKDVIYVWDVNDETGATGGEGVGAGSWISYSTSGAGDLQSGLIAPFQGFFVETDEGTPSLSIGTAAVNGSGTFRGKERESLSARLTLSGEGLGNATWLSFNEAASIGRDRADALQLEPLSRNFAVISTQDTDGRLLDINNLPFIDEELELPLIVRATRNGEYTIALSSMNLPENFSLHLRDNELGITQKIDESFVYDFSYTDAVVAKSAGMGNVMPEAMLAEDKNSRFTLIVAPTITLDAGEVRSELPDRLALGQNYPNPFNPTTRISFELPSSQFVKLSVFNMLGQEVSTLLQTEMNAGSHFVNFDASQLSSGVYVYRLEAGGQVITRKMTLVK